MYDQVITLVKETATVDAYGDRQITETSRVVFAELKSIGQSEFYQAEAVGLKPEIKFILPDYLDYQGEKKLLYQAFDADEASEYVVIRTYRSGHELEITCARGVDR